MNVKEIRKNNLRKLIDTRFNGSVNAFAKLINRSSSFFYDVFANKRILGENIMRAIEAELGLKQNELDQHGEKDELVNNFKIINVYSLKSSLNNHAFSEEIIDQIVLSNSLITINNWDSTQLICFEIPGNSMSPTIQNGSRVLINQAEKEIIDNKIYAFKKGDIVFIKRLFNGFEHNKIIAKSDNLAYPELHIDLDNNNSEFVIIGMAVLKLQDKL